MTLHGFASGDRKLLGEYRASIMQRAFLTMELAKGSTEVYRQSTILKLAFLIEPGVDLRRLERAVQRLAARHESLRMSFKKSGGDWRVKVWDRPQSGVVVEDHGELDEEERLNLVLALTDRPLDVLNDDLIQYLVAKTGKSGDILVVRAHHAVVDGHSMLILAEELLKFLLGVPVFGDGISHAQYLREIEDLPPRRLAENEAYWQNLLFPALPQPGSGSFGTGVETPGRIYSNTHFRSLQFKLSNEDYELLPAKARASGQSDFSILFAAFAQTYLNFSGLPGIYVMTYVDRLASRLKHYVGCAVQVLPVRCENPEKFPLAQFAAKLTAQFKESIAHTPSDACGPDLRFADAVRNAGGVLPHIHCGEIFQNTRAKLSAFAGNFEVPPGTRQRMGPVFITKLPLRQERFSSNGFSLRILRDGGVVNLDISYHNHLYPDKDVADFAQALQNQLDVVFR